MTQRKTLVATRDLTPGGARRRPFRSRTPAQHRIRPEAASQARMCASGEFRIDSGRQQNIDECVVNTSRANK